MNNFIKHYIPCSEAQRTKIEALRNARRLKQYKDKLILVSIGIDIKHSVQGTSY